MSIGSLLSRVVPTAIGYATGGPVGAVTAAASVEQGKQQERDIKAAMDRRRRQEQQIRSKIMAIGDPNAPGAFPTPRPANLGQTGFFERLGNLGSNVGNTLLSGLESAVPSVVNRLIFGGGRTTTSTQGPAVTTVTNVGAQESQGSGTIDAGAGALLPGLISGARNLLKTPGGQLALGGGIGLATSMIGPDGKPMRVTRKMKSQLKSLLRMTNNNVALVGDFLGLDQDQMLFILNKRFRNDGPVVTKAALRKTRQTIRRLHSMQNVLKSITPTATGRRRAPMKRATTTTLIKN